MFGNSAFKGALRSLNRRSYHVQAVKDSFNLFLGKPTVYSSYRSLYLSCKLQSHNPDWQTKGLIPTTFLQKHGVLLIHAWMMHDRLMKEGSYGQTLDEALYDEMWSEIASWLRSEGVQELMINKQLLRVQQLYFTTCMHLDDAVSYHPDEEEVLLRIGDVIWKNFYNEATDKDEYIEAFAKYIRGEQLSLLSLPSKAITEGRVCFSGFPKFPALNYTKEEEEAEKARLERIAKYGDWYEDRSIAGRPFFWNTQTFLVAWEKPKLEDEISVVDFFIARNKNLK